MKNEFYRQCVLLKCTNDGKIHYKTVWIPENLAHVNRSLKIMEKDWDYGWKVKEVGTRQSEQFVLNHERDYLTQRQASDV